MHASNSWHLVPSPGGFPYYEARKEGEPFSEYQIPFFKKVRVPSSFSSLEAIEKWISDTEKELARRLTLRFLAQRSHTEHQIRAKLSRKGISSAVVDPLVEELMRQGFLDDKEAFVREAEKEIGKGRGPRLIRLKLRAKGLEGDLDAIYSRERQKAVLLREIGKGMKKEGSYLPLFARRGFDLDLIHEALRTD